MIAPETLTAVNTVVGSSTLAILVYVVSVFSEMRTKVETMWKKFCEENGWDGKERRKYVRHVSR